MTPPDPAGRCLLTRADQADRLWIVDHNHLFIELHTLPILLVVHQKYFLRGLGQFIAAAMQRIMKGLGNLKEVVAARDHVPTGGHFQFREQRHQTVQHLGHAAANRGGVDHLDGLTLQIAGQKTQGIHLRLANNVPIIIQAR